MTRKIIAITSQILMLFCLIYSTIVHDSIIPYYIFFPLWIFFVECFDKIDLKKQSIFLVRAFYLLEIAYALFLYWKKTDYISDFFPLSVGVMCIIPNAIKWLLKNRKDRGGLA